MRKCLLIFLLLGLVQPLMADDKPIELGSRRELFVDDYLIDKRESLELRLQAPVPREVVMVHDQPWEGTGCCYYTIFRDGDIVRMYYVGQELTNADASTFSTHPVFPCYAESKDGIHWTKPELGLVEFQGSKKNNIFLSFPGADNFTPFKDTRPGCPPEQLYKAVAEGKRALMAFVSADGIHWDRLGDTPIITKGRFDSQNVVFWDNQRRQYWCYFRDAHDGIRDIRWSTSPDFKTWSEPQPLVFTDGIDEQLYTNQVQPYPRAPHLFVGFPTRYVEESNTPSIKNLPFPEHRAKRSKISMRYGTAVTDCLFMTSRDGKTFRRWDEAFLTPGIERKYNWVYGDCYMNLGLVETVAADPEAPPELSVYFAEDNWHRATRLRRYTLREDGFVALHARRAAGEMLTKLITFAGKKLELNFTTSAAGKLRVELQDERGKPLPGFALTDCDELFGDTLARTVSWHEKTDVSSLAGQPIRMRVVMSEADLFSMRFAD
jgi:hypothetical protein